MLTLSGVFPRDPFHLITISLFILALFIALTFVAAFKPKNRSSGGFGTVRAYVRFCYACFVKPHTGDGTGNQQDALESFYKYQADVYDATRTKFLRGREDMLALVAAQLKYRVEGGLISQRPVWVDVGGGTGYNVEQMNTFVSVPEFFRAVYVVDLSPSLRAMAQKRFARLGWKNVKVICQDARAFRLHEHEHEAYKRKEITLQGQNVRDLDENADAGGAELVTMSYSLSLVPEFYPVIDSVASLLSPNGFMGVVDFYVQNQVDYQSRNYTGGLIDRHCIWISRVFWRTWFEIDRVNLEPARRDYLEYRFGTVLSINARNSFFGVKLPYYVWIGCSKNDAASTAKLAEIDAAATESPYLNALDLQTGQTQLDIEIHSKAYESAIVNLQSSLPLPATWYQNHHWRIHYDDTLTKHTRFNNTYIYAFTWEDDLADARLLNVQSHDVILAITSAGDNILSFLLSHPHRLHAVDLNPAQNHLLELKVAAFTALGYPDVWKLFGEGRYSRFRELLVEKLSPHLSSRAFQYWLQIGPGVFNHPSSSKTKNKNSGLYYSGCSGNAVRLVSRLFSLLGLRDQLRRLCEAETLNEQREIWDSGLKTVLHSKILTWLVIGNEKWLWKALGVPPRQRDMIVRDYVATMHGRGDGGDGDAKASAEERKEARKRMAGEAIHAYVLATFTPIIQSTLLSSQNPYYLLPLLGHYTPRCHPTYLSPRSHIKLSKPAAFNNLRIHTDEICEVVARTRPGTLTIVVVMDSMDWFPREGGLAERQVGALNRAMRVGGRVLLRSAGLVPWYVRVFGEGGFACRRVGVRECGGVVDRVNMYASTWICTKERSVGVDGGKEGMGELGIGEPALEC